jgi:vacuolar protein sorting-associated protein 41
MTGKGPPEVGDDHIRDNSEEPELAHVEPRPEDYVDPQKIPDDGGEGETLTALKAAQYGSNVGEAADDNEEEEEDEEDEDEEPKLKYARLTQHLSAVYRNGDMTSTFIVAGDKMIIGSDDGNISIVQMPMFQAIRVYHAHSSSVTNISVSPYPPPLPPTTMKSEVAMRAVSQSHGAARPSSRQSDKGSTTDASPRKRGEPTPIPNIPSNNLHITTASMDGNVCVQSLVDMKDVSLRNFARPVLAVALSPDYKNDKTYLSGGKAGELVLTVNPPPRRSTSNTVASGAVAAASGWLGSVGLGTTVGKDVVLHSGEGDINAIKWSLSGKYVVWLNEHGIKIMRSKLHLDSSDAEDAWKRIGHIDRPQTQEWAEMASMWKGRIEWIDEKAIRSDVEAQNPEVSSSLSPAASKLKQTATNSEKRIERLLVGWGGTIWIVHVHPGGVGVGRNVGERSIGKAEIAKKYMIPIADLAQPH